MATSITKIALLYPPENGVPQQNHWVIALPNATGTLASREEKAKLWWQAIMRNHGWTNGDYEQLEVTGSKIGKPEEIQARWVQLDVDEVRKLPADTTYVALAFTYLGEGNFGAHTSMPWPEIEGVGMLYGVAQPVAAVHVPTEWELQWQTFKKTALDLGSDAADLGSDLGHGAANLGKSIPTVVSLGIVLGIGLMILNTSRSR